MKGGKTEMKRLIAIALTALCTAIAGAVPREFAADVTRPRTFQTECYRGETLEIAARLTDGGRPYAVPAGASAAMLVSTNGADWWEWPASVTTGGVVSATWEPRMDSGAAAHRIFLGVSEGGTNRNYGANMLLRMLGSPGEAPNALPLPARRIDFALVSVTNAPWATPADIPDVAAMTASVARSATNHADEVASAVAVAATNQANAVGADVAIAATNYTDAAVASATNGLRRAETDPVWEREKGDYARTLGPVTFRPNGNDGGTVVIGNAAGTPYVEIDGTKIWASSIEDGDAATARASTNYTDRIAASALLADASGMVTNRDSVMVNSFGVSSMVWAGGGMLFYHPGGGEFQYGDEVARRADLAPYATTASLGAAVASVARAATNYTDRVSALSTNALDTAIRTRGYLTSHQDISGKADKTAVPGTVSNVVTKTYVESLGIEAGIDGAGVSNIVTKSYVEGLGIEAGVSGQAVTNIVDGKIAELDIDQESLARAVQLGEDLALIDADTNGWHIAVSNVVETDQAHIHGLLILGDTVYGAPENGDRIDIDGCDFFYNRQIPGDTTQTNGYGNLVTDPYMEWRLAQFFADYNAETTRMWNQVATINNLPDTLDDDLRTYNSVTSNLEAATMEVNLVRDEVNMSNAVMRAAFDRALAEAASSGEGWSATNATDECLILTDHGVTTCSASTSSYYIMLPSWTGTPAHCLAWFDNAAAWSDSPPSFYTSSAGAVYVDEALPAEFHAGGGKYLFDFRQLDEDTWFLSVHPAGVGFLGGNAR